MQLRFEDDEGAWRRRLILINYECPAPQERIVHFDRILFDTESSGILNWALDGAVELLASGGVIVRSKEQQRKAEILLLSSDPVGYFVKNYIKYAPTCQPPGCVIIQKFREFCKAVGWAMPSERRIQTQIKDMLFNIHGVEQSKNVDFEGHAVRGYRNCKII